MPSAIFPYVLIRSAGWSLPSMAIAWPDAAAQEIREQGAELALQQAFDEALASLPDSAMRTAVYNARKRFFQKKQVPPIGWEQFLAENQTPEIKRLLACLEARRLLTHVLPAEGAESGLHQNWRTIQQAAQAPDFQRALLFASHDLLDRLPVFCAKAPEQFTAKDRQTGLSLLLYLSRGAYKTSPLSRFTTVSVRAWQSPTPAADEERPAFMQVAKAVLSPNVALLPALYEVLLAEPAFYTTLTLHLNPCITGHQDPDGRVWLYFDGEHESFQHMNHNKAVEAVIGIFLAQGRSIAWFDLIKKLVKKISAEETEVAGLIHELVAIGLLAWQLPERGLGPGWCGALYNYLGHLPMLPVISDSAALLQWLRTAARTLPFQNIAEAQATQRQTVEQIRVFFTRYTSVVPPIPPEQIFFEDVEKPATGQVAPEVVQTLVEQLAACWRQAAPQHVSPFRSALQAFAMARLAEGDRLPFLDFCKKFLLEKAQWEQGPPGQSAPYTGKIGALIQVFQRENGEYGAVINGLFPGGGKLVARWLHLFPADLRAALQDWFPEQTLAFPWQGWSNANFQPLLADMGLQVPDGRVGAPDQTVLLGNLEVQRGADGPFLVDAVRKRPIHFTDLGLESPATRPPAMQVLWHLGMPAVSLENIWPQTNTEENGAHQPRLEFQSLVLRRARWRITPDIWQRWIIMTGSIAERIQHLRSKLQEQPWPQQFFVRFYPGKPQFIDRDSPVYLLLLEKVLRGAKSDLWVVEMLPAGREPVKEWVVEWQ